MLEEKTYLQLYNDFVNNFSRTVTDATDIGEIIVRLTQHFSAMNLELASAEDRFNQSYAAIIQQTDDNNKSISAAKADILVKNTEEHRECNKKKKELENVEQMLNSLKSLQRGVLNEYSHMSMT